MNELHRMLVQEETRLKNQGSHSINLLSHPGARKKARNNKGKGKQGPLKVNKSSAPNSQERERMIIAISVINLGSIRKIAKNIKHGSKRKVRLMLSYVLNLIWLKSLTILGGLILVVQLMFQI